MIAAGIFGIIAAPFISRLLPLFPPVVTGTIIMVIGISLMRVGINWAGGGLPTLTKVVEGVPGAFPNPGYGQLQGLGIALFVLLVILGLIKWGSGFISNVSVLLGIIAGAILASVLGVMHFEKVAAAPWGDIVLPLHFGVPQFHLVPIITMCIVMIVVMIESLGMFLALGEITGKTIDRDALTRGLRADGVGTLFGGLFNTFPYTSFSQNVGLVSVTGVRSRWVTIAGGGIMLLLGLLPKMAALVEAVPLVVLGGAGLVMFGMVAATGARILTGVDFQEQPLQSVRGGDFGRLRHDPAGGAELLPQPAARPAAAAGIRHPAVRAGGGAAERVLQRHRQQRRGRSRRGEGGGIGAACVSPGGHLHHRHTPRKRGIQYAAASRFDRKRLWNTGSPAFAGDDSWSVTRNLSTPPIGRVAPGRDQQRHVEMAFGVAHRKPQRDAIEKRRIGHRHAARGKIFRGARRSVHSCRSAPAGRRSAAASVRPSLLVIPRVTTRLSPRADSSISSNSMPAAGVPLWVSSTWVDSCPCTCSRSSDATS